MKTFKTMVVVLALSVSACNGGTPRGDGQTPADDVQVTSGVTLCPFPGQIAVDEICNGFDDDCDGVIDENVCSDPCDSTF